MKQRTVNMLVFGLLGVILGIVLALMTTTEPGMVLTLTLVVGLIGVLVGSKWGSATPPVRDPDGVKDTR